ncbi:MAG: hypothetical protein IT426_11800 [Pirellulales bacterium]|nr:hypothetical protein [Pirellulales bacterium]
MSRQLTVFCFVLTCSAWPGGRLHSAEPVSAIVAAQDGAFAERLAAREIRRYFYLTTGKLLPIADKEVPGAMILVGAKQRSFFKDAGALDPSLARDIESLQPEQYLLKTISHHGRRALLVAGGDPAGALYGAYRLAEQLGVRFYLHGDVVPDGKIAPTLPVLDLVGKPLFAARGIQPFHDFPEGPDWWNLDDYKAYLGQLPKMGMNFFGLHTYPEGGVGPEPLTWIGLPEEILDGGKVKASYPARHFTIDNITGAWGYRHARSSLFSFGAAQLFDRDDYGADYMRGASPWNTMTPERSNKLFDDVGIFLNEAFTYARRLHIKTCLGTETPLTIPKEVRARLKAAGKDPADPAVVQKVYEGIFARIAKTHPLDYYWLWTDESWTWAAVKQEQIDAVQADFRAALKAMDEVKPPFALATCGWVLGPPQSPALFDECLPKNVPLSCINRQVGNTPVEPGFAAVLGRPKWAIPWMEDDPGMTMPQLWAGRMRRDAFDALAYGCNGLLGIHWRTEVLAPNVSALAKAAWDQSGWSKRSKAELQAIEPSDNVSGGQAASFPNNKIADARDEKVYQSVRYDVDAYRLKIPNGTYAVTLKFCEPYYSEKGKRIFGAKLQGKKVIDKLDIFEKAGQDRAFDFTFKDVKVDAELLKIEFLKQVEFPSIAAIVVEGTTAGSNQFPGGPFVRKINCGGPAYLDYEADFAPQNAPDPGRYMPVDDFYADWAKASFGANRAGEIAKIFTRLDGFLPRPADWVTGPGSIRPDRKAWKDVAKQYGFVEELAALRPEIEGAGNLQRFDYWLNQFRYLREIAKVRCTWGEYETAIKKIRAEKDADARKLLARETVLPIRLRLVEAFAEMHRDLLATVSTPGEFGNVANWRMQTLPVVLEKPGEELAKMLGEALPAEAMPSSRFTGIPRLIVPTVRTGILAGETLAIRAIVLGSEPSEAAVFWRPLGAGEFKRAVMQRLPRGGYAATLPAAELTDDFEYYLEAKNGSAALKFPATAPEKNQSVLVVEE